MEKLFRTPVAEPRKIAIPPHAHPIVRLIFTLMRDRGASYNDVEYYSGVLKTTLKSWKTEKTPTLQSLEAVLGVFGYSLIPCPPLDDLPPDVLAECEDLGMHFRSDHEMLAAAAAAVAMAHPRGSESEPAPRLQHYRPYQMEAAA